jgi:hypothetical protein
VPAPADRAQPRGLHGGRSRQRLLAHRRQRGLRGAAARDEERGDEQQQRDQRGEQDARAGVL